MKKLFFLVLLACSATANAQWKPVGDRIKTQWAETIDPNNVLPEYPRPIMQRDEWMNLNGLWNYAIRPKGESCPTEFDGQILVPFAVESSLSGVGKTVGADKELWYERYFELPRSWRYQHVLLNFGAVDWQADVWINDSLVCSHQGGYTAFSTDISRFLFKKGQQKIVVRVWDPTDKGTQPRGKQVSNPNGIWYSSVTGIWQTVWLEPVFQNYFKNVRLTPDIDRHLLLVESDPARPEEHDEMYVTVYEGKKKVAWGKSVNGKYTLVKMPEQLHLWSPDDPFLYTVKVELKEDKITIDSYMSYAAMRKVSIADDANGIRRLFLNDKPLFMFGPLDQGWWPDGLYTAPTDEALRYDIEQTKALGFNMIRKHVKVEPARWYTHCDQLGILVWQDMPSGDGTKQWITDRYYEGDELQRTPQSERQYRQEWMTIMSQRHSNPSIVVWVPFNEAWGQFKTRQIAEATKRADVTRLVNPASGGNFFKVGDILDIHHYPNPEINLTDPDRATVLGEYGGLGLPVEGHLWNPDGNWGYVKFKSGDEVTDEYVKYIDQLKSLQSTGCSAAVYTQTTDVETEVNGLMTYDRKVVKLNADRVREANQSLIRGY